MAERVRDGDVPVFDAARACLVRRALRLLAQPDADDRARLVAASVNPLRRGQSLAPARAVHRSVAADLLDLGQPAVGHDGVQADVRAMVVQQAHAKVPRVVGGRRNGRAVGDCTIRLAPGARSPIMTQDILLKEVGKTGTGQRSLWRTRRTWDIAYLA